MGKIGENMSKKMSRISLIMCFVGLLGVAALIVSARRTANANTEKTQSINVNNDEALQRYRLISTLSLSERRVYFNGSSDSVKSENWKTHFAEYLKKHPELSAAQRSVIEDASSLATAELFGKAKNAQEADPIVGSVVKVISGRANALFAKEEKRNIFGTLGEIDSSQKLKVAFVECECSRLTRNDFCSGTCKDLTGCSTSNGGCGWLWLQDCKGMCG